MLKNLRDAKGCATDGVKGWYAKHGRNNYRARWNRAVDRSGRVGSGRVGSGRVGSGRVGSGWVGSDTGRDFDRPVDF